MTNLFRKYAGYATVLALVFGVRTAAFAQTSVVVEVRVLELSRTDLENLGGTLTMPGFVKTLSKGQVESIATGPRSRVVHRIEVPSTSGISSQVRLDSRISVTSSSSGDVQTYFDAGIAIDMIPKVFQNRDIALATASQVRIRRGPEGNSGPLVIFENPSTRFDTRIADGESIVLGGLITAAERMTLPDMPLLPDNPILNYLYPKARAPQDRSEIAILLTPRIVGLIIDPAVDVPVLVSKPDVSSPPIAGLTPPSINPSATPSGPVASLTSASVNPPSVVTSPAAVVSRPENIGYTDGANRPTTIAFSPVISGPAPTTGAATPVNPSPVITPPPVVRLGPAVAALPEIEGTGGKYTVQVGAFDELGKAEALRAQLSKKYEMVFVEKVSLGKTPYRVRVGRFADMSAAKQLEQKLISDGIDTYITTLN